MSKMSELDMDRQQVERLTDVVPPPSFAVSKRAGGRQTLGALTKRDAAILTAWDSHKNYDAMAAALELPIGTVKSRLHRARARFARLHQQNKSEDF